MKNIAIIPARSGSKGLKDKNIKILDGIPLLAYSIVAAQKSQLFDEIMVSTDSKEYAEIAIQYGASVPFLRSKEKSDDKTGSWDVVKEVLYGYKQQEIFFDTVCLLQPTSPLRTEKDIIEGYKILEEKNANAITAMCEVEHSPLWTTTLPEDYSLDTFRERIGASVPRQQLQQYFQINGALYIRKIIYDNEEINLGEYREYALIMDRKHSIDIDTIDDFEYAEFLIKKGF